METLLLLANLLCLHTYYVPCDYRFIWEFNTLNSFTVMWPYIGGSLSVLSIVSKLLSIILYYENTASHVAM